MGMKNVVITGRGVVSSLGNTPEEIYDNLEKGLCAFKSEPSWRHYNGLETFVSAPAYPYNISGLDRNIRRSMSPMSEMAYIATVEALKESQLNIGNNKNLIQDSFHRPDSKKVALIMGSTTGSPIFLEQYFKKIIENGGPKGQMSTSFFKVMNHSIASNVALALGYAGPLLAPSSACSTSSQAVILAMQLIRAGLYDVVIVGGGDELHYTSVAVFDVVMACARHYNDRPESIPGPFAKNRDGLVVSEGAGILVLESEEYAKNRKAKIYGEIAGGAYFCDGVHMTRPQAAQMAITMREAIDDAQISLEQIDYVNAHATATLMGDEQEARAIISLFKNRKIPVSSLKGHFGHSLAACGTIEIISSLEMMKHSNLICNRNVEEVSEEFSQLDILTKNKKSDLTYVMSNNFAFGGMNTSIIVKKHF